MGFRLSIAPYATLSLCLKQTVLLNILICIILTQLQFCKSSRLMIYRYLDFTKAKYSFLLISSHPSVHSLQGRLLAVWTAVGTTEFLVYAAWDVTSKPSHRSKRAGSIWDSMLYLWWQAAIARASQAAVLAQHWEAEQAPGLWQWPVTPWGPKAVYSIRLA